MSHTDKRIDVWFDNSTYEKIIKLAHAYNLSVNEVIVRCVSVTVSLPTPFATPRLSTRRAARNEQIRLNDNERYLRKKKPTGGIT